MSSKHRHLVMVVAGLAAIVGAIVTIIVKDKPDAGTVIALISTGGGLLMFSDPKKAVGQKPDGQG